MGGWRPSRAIWSYEATSWSDPALDVCVTEDGVLIAVTEEKAMDSYNEEFTCSITLPPDKLVELVGVLQAALAGIETGTAETENTGSVPKG